MGAAGQTSQDPRNVAGLPTHVVGKAATVRVSPLLE
jgi:hypothetical protein